MIKKLLISTATCFLLSGSFVSAEVTIPYTVDEKDQVLFGDVTEVDGYYGLENYEYNYVDGYLNIKFTQTHHMCCYAGYPPLLFIYNTDPRATTTATMREASPAFSLRSGVHPTGWYSFDIQFDATGYTTKVTLATTTEISNLYREVPGYSQGDWVALANHSPRQDNDPSYTMSFTPLPVYYTSPPIIATTTPVIVVPGIMGSYLSNGESEIWMSLIKMSLPGPDAYLRDLIQTEEGLSMLNIEATDIIKKINIPLFSRDLFEDLMDEIVNSNYQENVDLFVFPYDWRLDVEQIAIKLNEKIEEIKTERGVDKVHLVSHSMGGLLVKKYLMDYGGDSVDKFIDIGTPHTGSPKSFLTLMYGETDIGILNKTTIKEISQNMPSVYQLLPSERYFEDDPGYYVLNGINGNNRLDFEETKGYLKGEGRNALLVDRASEFHEEIDDLDPEDYGVETYNFVGCGTPTIGQFYILEKKGDKYSYNIRMINGDGTVPLKSAEALPATQTFYVKNAQHALMPSTAGVKELIANLLTATSTENIDISPYSNLSLSSGGCTVPNGKIVSFHSPIELHVYDQSGNHVGPNSDGDVENNIEGVVYEVIDDNKFAYLPDGVEYTIKGSATAAGSFDVRIQEMIGGEVASTTIYADIPLTLTSQTSFVVGANLPSNIPVDHEGDNEFESTYPVSTTTLGLLEGTGKTAPVVEEAVIEENSTNLAQFTRNIEVEVVATSTESLLEPKPLPTSTPVLLLEPETFVENIETEIKESSIENNNIELEVPSLETETEEKYENTAVVYKSLGYKVKNLFINIWDWFKDLFR